MGGTHRGPESGEVATPHERRLLTRTQLLRISVYWIGMTAVWAGLSLQLQPAIVTELVCPHGVDGPACAVLPLDDLKPLIQDLRLRPEIAIGVLGILTAIVSILVQPIAAAASDRTRTRLGRRRPWIITGTILDLVFIVAIVHTETLLAFMALILLLAFSSNVAQGPFQGLVPDQVPDEQVGAASGQVGLMSLIGQLAGAAFAGTGVALGEPALGLLGLGALEVALVVPLLSGIDDRPVDLPPRERSQSAAALDALRTAWAHRSFVWLLVSRLFLFMAPATLVFAAQFFVTRSIGFSVQEAAGTILVTLAITVASAASVAAWAGRASTTYGRRPMIWASCVIGAVGMTILAMGPSEYEVALAGVRFPLVGLAVIPIGIGSGMFLSVDWALMIDIVPRAEAARYLGLSNVVTSTAGALAGAFGGLVMATVTEATGLASLGPRAALLSAIVYYALGAWALVRVDLRRTGAPSSTTTLESATAVAD
jgi:MFS family permease